MLRASSPPFSTHPPHLQASTDAAEFFRNALLFLAYSPLDQLSLIQQGNLAFDLCIAALIGEKIYNFGELLAHPILATLETEKSHSWMVDLLKCFHRGDIVGFDGLLASNKELVAQQPAITGNMVLLKSKITLLCLVSPCCCSDTCCSDLLRSPTAVLPVLPTPTTTLLLLLLGSVAGGPAARAVVLLLPPRPPAVPPRPRRSRPSPDSKTSRFHRTLWAPTSHRAAPSSA